MLKDLNNRILLILSYTDQFKYPLTKEEIFLRVIGQSDRSLTIKKIEKKLLELVLAGKVAVKDNFYFIKGSDKYIDVRIKRKIYSQKKWLEAKEFVRLIKIIPWVKAVLVTGSLAVDNVIENDDIDFLIITQENRLWISRILVVLFAFLKGKKRSWYGKFHNTWCLNLWLDDKSLELPERLRNVYGAFEICQAVWVYDRGNTKQVFFDLNIWAKTFLPNYFVFQKETVPYEISSSGKATNLFIDFFLNKLNSFSFFLQYLYMRPHITSEKVNKNFAFFHPRDTKKQVLGRWLKTYKKTV